MKLKLTAFLAVVILALSGCNAADTGNRAAANANTAVVTTQSSNAPAPTAKTDTGSVPASTVPTETAGGTNEGCKCSAVEMTCKTKDGKTISCCGKDGCTNMKDGTAKCCGTEGKAGEGCCSAAKATAATGSETAPSKGTEKKPETAASPAKKPA